MFTISITTITGGNLRIILAVLFVALLALMLVIGSYNDGLVPIHFLIVQLHWPLATVMALMLFCGFIIGLLVALTVRVGSNAKAKVIGKDAQLPATVMTNTEERRN